MKYNNTTYWQNLHKEFPDSLKAVGISSLTEEYNSLKYASESGTMLEIFDGMVLPLLNEEAKILDIGSGIGVWSHLFFDHCTKNNLRPAITAVDVSSEALETITKKNPRISVQQIDLKTVNRDLYAEQFDCVIAVCCFHHIVDLQGYVNALSFAARSVKPNGFLIIEDPILMKAYSKFYQVDYSKFSGHSFPRPSYLIDDVILSEGFTRRKIVNALSFLLSGNMESNSKWGYFIQRKLWNLGYIMLYRSKRAVALIAPLVRMLDTFFKKTKYSNGTIYMVYQKTAAPNEDR